MSYHASESYGNSLGGDKWDDGTFSGIRKITLTAKATTLTSIQVTYGLLGNDPSVLHRDFGGITHGEGGEIDQQFEFTLDFPNERITKMSGYRGHADGHDLVRSLSFETNTKRTLGPYGPQSGTAFQTDVHGSIVGFFGTSGTRLDSIGAYISTQNYYASESYGNSLGGGKWDDGTFSGIRKITLTAKATTLTSIQVTYGLLGHDPSVLHRDFGGITHGEGGEIDQQFEFTLDFPNERITKMSGYRGHADGHDLVRSLSFETNTNRTLGPYGPQNGTAFQTDVHGSIVGFFGTSGTRLDSIGAYMLLD